MNTNLVNPLVLAYIGDAIYELEIRKRIVLSGVNKVNDLQEICTKYVSARGQSDFVEKMIESNILTEDELDIYKRARNSHVKSHPSNTDIVTYKRATGFEALLGYLYLNNKYDRILELVEFVMEV